MEFAKLGQDEIRIKYENELKEIKNKYIVFQKKVVIDKKKSSAQLEMKENIIQK